MSPDRGDDGRMALLRELMDAHGRSVLQVIYSYVKDRHAAEDLSQDVFVKVFDHLDSFRQESSYKTWILRIAVNCAKDYLRSSARRVVPVDDLSYVPSDRSTEQVIVAKAQDEALWGAVMSLPVMYRETIWLFYNQELSVDEIALITQVSNASVKTRLHRGRELLRRVFEGGGMDESSGGRI